MPSPRSRPRGRSTSSKSFEPERFGKRQEYQKSNHQDEDRELCMKKLSEFNESLWRQGQSTSTKYEWNHILLNSPGKAADAAATMATMPELAMQNEITAPTYSVSPMGIGLMKENRFIESRPLHLKPGFVNNGENFPYPNVGNSGMIGEAVDFGVYGENLGFDSTSVISEMARNRIRRIEEVTEFAHRKMESLARASAVDSIIDKIDGAGQNRAVELDPRISSSQQYMNEHEREIFHGGRHQQREYCSTHALTQRYGDFSAQREDVRGVGVRMDHTQSQSSRGALFYGERQRLGESGGHVLPPLYPDLNEKSDRNVKVQDNGALGCRMNVAQCQNEAVFLGESQQFQHSLAGTSHEMEHQNELCGTRRNCHLSPKRALMHGARQELPENYGHSLTRNHFDFGRESHVKEQSTDVSRSWMNPPLDQKRALLNGGRLELSEVYGHPLPRCYLDFNVDSHENQQENEILGSGMNHPHKQKGAPFLGVKLQMHEDFCRSLPQHNLGLHEMSHVMVKENEVLASWMNHHQPLEQKGASLHGESQLLLRECALESYPLPKQDDNVYTTEVLASRMNHHKPQEQKGASLHGESQQLLGECALESYPLPKQDDNVYTTEILASRMNHHKPQEQKGASLHGESQQLLGECALESYPLPKQDDNVYTTEVLASRVNHHQPQEQKGASLHGESQQLLRECALESYPLPKQDDNVYTTEVLSSRMNHHQPQEQKGDSLHGESQQLLRECALEIYPLPKQDDNVCTTEGGTPLISATEETGINSQSLKSLPKKRIIDLRKIRESRISRLTQTSDGSGDEILDMEYGGEQLNDEERDIVFDELQSNRKNIKERLGPSCQIHNPNPSNRKSVKQRLGPPCQVHNPKGVSQVGRHKMKKRLKKNVYDFQEVVQAQDVDIPDVKRGRIEPREDSEEFKQLIHVPFLKFAKVLNENPAQRRKYTEKGEAPETLKCCVCGSKSKEFVNPQSLATHASMSLGRRVDHLGFHKALCLLMGWNPMAASNGAWIQKALPDAEALAMKEDLVVWPPTVILYNSSITTSNSDDRVIVSVEEVEAFIKDMGFGREISKVCRGKPANQSIMTVIFHGTFSGLLKAERLHQLYSDNKHGRAEFQQINCNIGQPLKVPTNKVEDVLYGYLGIAGDLDKLDFETKSRSTVKSKKEIYAIAGAPLNNEKLGSY